MKPGKSYMVCTTPRSGGLFLCEALGNTGLAGNPGEFLYEGWRPEFCKAWGITAFPDFFRKALEYGSTPNGTFGAKVINGDGIWGRFIDDLRTLPDAKGKDLPVPELLHELFPNLHYIWLTRRNKVRQAVSWCRATQTGVFRMRKGERQEPKNEPVFDFESIDLLLQGIVMREAEWQEYFGQCGISPFVIVYEDFVTAYEETVLSILRFLGIPIPSDLVFKERQMTKQADTLSDDWVREYLRHKQVDWPRTGTFHP